MGFEPCLSALERPTRAVRSETIAVRNFTSSVKSVWASPPIGWRALPGTRAADSEDSFIRVVGTLRSIHAPHPREECGHGRIGAKRQCVRAPTTSFPKLARRVALAVPSSINLWCPGRIRKLPPRGEIGDAGVDGPNWPSATWPARDRPSARRAPACASRLPAWSEPVGQATRAQAGERQLSRRQEDAIDGGHRTTALGDPAREAPPGDHGGAMATTGSHRAKPFGGRGRRERRQTKRDLGSVAREPQQERRVADCYAITPNRYRSITPIGSSFPLLYSRRLNC